MSQKALPAVVKKRGLTTIRYREGVRGRSFNGTMTTRASSTQGSFKVWYGGTKVTKTTKNVASTGMKQTDVVYNH
jgi:hypothetical protein